MCECKCDDNTQTALNILAHIYQEAHDGDLSGERIRWVVDGNPISLPHVNPAPWTLVLGTEAKREAKEAEQAKKRGSLAPGQGKPVRRAITVLMRSGGTLDFKGSHFSERDDILTIFRDEEIVAQFPPTSWGGVYYATTAG